MFWSFNDSCQMKRISYSGGMGKQHEFHIYFFLFFTWNEKEKKERIGLEIHVKNILKELNFVKFLKKMTQIIFVIV